MGSTVSVLDKVAQKSLPELVERANVRLTEGEIIGSIIVVPPTKADSNDRSVV